LLKNWKDIGIYTNIWVDIPKSAILNFVWINSQFLHLVVKILHIHPGSTGRSTDIAFCCSQAIGQVGPFKRFNDILLGGFKRLIRGDVVR